MTRNPKRLALRLALFALAGFASAQRGTGPAGPPVATERANYEAKGDFDFLNSCAICHGRVERAPSLTVLQSLSPEKIFETITTGSMKTQAANLSKEQKIKIAEFLSGRTLGLEENGDARRMSNVCAENPSVKDTNAPSWNGWSPNALTNTRYQPGRAAALSPAAVPR